MIRTELTYNCLTIYDGGKVHKRAMGKILRAVRKNAEPGATIVFERSLFSLKKEWICHRFLYMIGYQRERTLDVDLDNPCDHPEWLYMLCGCLVWILVW